MRFMNLLKTLVRKALEWLDCESNTYAPPTLYTDYMARWRKPDGKR